MNGFVEVTREAEGGLERERWQFEIFDFPTVYLGYYGVEQRRTRRHKWVVSERYTCLSRIGAVDRAIRAIRELKEEPEVPEDVLEEGLEKMRDLLEFKIWRKGR